MSDFNLDEIEARHERDCERHNGVLAMAGIDRAALIARVKELEIYRHAAEAEANEVNRLNRKLKIAEERNRELEAAAEDADDRAGDLVRKLELAKAVVNALLRLAVGEAADAALEAAEKRGREEERERAARVCDDAADDDDDERPSHARPPQVCRYLAGLIRKGDTNEEANDGE